MPFIRGVRTQSERGWESVKLRRNRPQLVKTRGKRLFFHVDVRETGGQRRQTGVRRACRLRITYLFDIKTG